MTKPWTFRFLLSATALAVLAACGGGGSSSGSTTTARPASVKLQTYITDNLTTTYSKVWVSVLSITAVDEAGDDVTLLDATASPIVVNLSELASVGQLLSTSSIPVGRYTALKVTLVNAVQLVRSSDGSTLDAKFAATGTDYVLTLDEVEFEAADQGQLVLDFDLARFTYDAATGLVTPHVEVPDPDTAFRRFVRQQAEVHGRVLSVDAAAGTLTIRDRHLGDGVVVTLAADAVIVDEDAGTTLALADVPVDARIEITGTVTPGATTADPVTVTASVIHIEHASSKSERTHGEGTVQSVDGTRVTVALSEADFMPGSNTVVVDIADARFSHGEAADLVEGVTVHFRGRLSGTGADTVLAATVVDVEGAASEHDREAHPDRRFSVLKGTVGEVGVDGTFTLEVTESEGHRAAAGTYTVDASSAVYLEGNGACLVADAKVKAIGALTEGALLARFLKIDDCEGVDHADPSEPEDARD